MSTAAFAFLFCLLFVSNVRLAAYDVNKFPPTQKPPKLYELSPLDIPRVIMRHYSDYI